MKRGMILTAAGWGILLSGGGCEKRPAAPAASAQKTAGATQKTAVDTPATAPALIALPAVVRIAYNTSDPRAAVAYQFPAAKLVLSERGGILRASLFSDDPRESLKAAWAGNSFYFDMDLDVATRGEIDDAVYTYAAPSQSDLGDSSNGFFLDGGTKVLRPLRLKMRFGKVDGQQVVLLEGEFADLNAPDTGGPAPVATAQARLLPVVVTK